VGKLFFHMGVFALVTLAVYAACLWLVRFEDKRQARHRR